MFDFEGDDDFDTLSALRDYEGPGDFATQAPGGAWGARAALLAGPGAGGYLDAPAASQEAAQSDAARAERDRLAAEEIARREAEDAERRAREDAEAARVQVGGTVVINPDGTATVTGGEQLSPEELAFRQAEQQREVARRAAIHAAQQQLRGDLKAATEQMGAQGGYGTGGAAGGAQSAGLGGGAAQQVANRFASGEYRQPEGSLGRALSQGVDALGGLVSGLPGALASLFLGQQASGLSGLLANVLGAADSSATNLELARRLAAQVLGVTVPQLDELQRYVTEQRAQWEATAEHRQLMSQDQFRADVLARMWSVEERLRQLQGSVDMIGPARW